MRTLFLLLQVVCFLSISTASSEEDVGTIDFDPVLQDSSSSQDDAGTVGFEPVLEEVSLNSLWSEASNFLLSFSNSWLGCGNGVPGGPRPPSQGNPIPTQPPDSSPSSPTAPLPAPAPSDSTGFQITLRLSGVNNDYEFRNAKSQWESVVTGELPDHEGPLEGSSYCGAWPQKVDDLYVCGAYKPIDGPGGVLGAAGPRHYRPSNGIPITGQMRFDSADIYRSGFDLVGVILHEMGHVLGLGSMWKINGLTNSYSPPCPYSADSRASSEFRAISGCSSEAIPIEHGMGQGSHCGHWDEECLGNEIMTPTADLPFLMSRITIAGLEDIGYSVDYGRAESYRASDMSSTCRCNNNNRRLRSDSNSHKSNSTIFGENDTIHNNTATPLRRKLSEEGRRIAIDFGKSQLEENRQTINNFVPGSNTIPDMGGEVIYVLYQETDGSIHSVMVTEEMV